MNKRKVVIIALIVIGVMIVTALVAPWVIRCRKTLGLTISVTDATPTSATLKCVRGLGFVAGSVETGSAYYLERQTPDGWEKVEELPTDENVAWTMEAIKIPFGNSRQTLNYGNIYGELQPGTYRVCKAYFTYRENSGAGRSVWLYAEFEIK